jgi:integrase
MKHGSKNTKKLWLKIGGGKLCGLYRYEPSGAYFARVRFRGRLVRRKLDTTDVATAKRKLSDFRRDLERTDATKGNTSFAAALDDYSATLTGAQSTLEDKHAIIEKLKATLFGCGTLPLRSLRASQIEAWLAKHYGGKSASLYNSALSVIRAAIDAAVRDRVITENPVAHLKYQKRATPIRLTPTFEQFNQLVANIRSQPFSPDKEQSGDFVEFLGLAGLGQAEAAAITRSQVDLDAAQIIIHRHKTDTGFVIPIYPQLRPLVEKLCAGKQHDERLFSVNAAHRALTSACERLGFAHFTHRSLRRMFITRAIERGVDVKVIAQWQGHKDGGRLILSTYSHVRPEHSNRMAQLMTTEQPHNVVPIAAQA